MTMTTQDFPATLPSLAETLSHWLKSFRCTDIPATRVTPDETRARRDFIREMLDRHPDALTSETEVQTMMLVYPGRF